jgi:hypothetical protein
MLGVPIDGPALMLGDNASVIASTSIPSSPLRKKHNAVAYHRVREAIAAGIIKFAKIGSKENISDCLTKPLGPDDFLRLVKRVLFRTPTDRVTGFELPQAYVQREKKKSASVTPENRA